MREDSRFAVCRSFAVGILTLSLMCAVQVQAQTSERSSAGAEAGGGEQCELEAGVEGDLGICGAGVSREQELGAAAGAIEGGGIYGAGGVADEPTAFIASYGEGKPVVAILGEFDALPGLSQQAVPERAPVTAGAPGHGCGHNLLGSGAALAAVAVKQYMEANHVKGTLRYYGTPAEEGGSGKVYMVRAGVFKDVDVVLHWHPGDRNAVIDGGALAVTSAKFTFHGIAAHAAMAPDRGRSALDAVMLMGNGIEFMREHVPQQHAHALHHFEGRGCAEHCAGPGADGPDGAQSVEYYAAGDMGAHSECRERRCADDGDDA